MTSGKHARVGIIVLVAVAFLSGLAASALYFRGASRHSRSQGSEEPRFSELSEHTRSVLKRLTSSVEIRFYALLKDPGVRDTLGAFAGRVDQLLAEYEREAGGKIHFVRHTSPSVPEMDAAAADGIAAFNREKGDACYLGIAVDHNGRKESIPQLLPDWEQALEPDLTRAIERVTRPSPAQLASAKSVETTPHTVAEIKRLFPNLDSVSVEEGTAILREVARIEYTEAATKSQTAISAAENHYRELNQSGRSETEQRAALKQLQEAQAEQAQKLNEIAVRFRARSAAFEQLKRAAH